MRLGTRRSALALAQARLVASRLGELGEEWEIVPITTAGDMRPPGWAGSNPGAEDKSRWVTELELALQDGTIDLAVHSAKDVPARLADGLALLGAPTRGAVEDVVCGAPSLRDLQAGARVGTSSVRRVAQLRAEREDLDVVAIAGNVDTRLAKLADPANELDAIVLARAGMRRLARESEIGAVLDPAVFVPAPGQGTLALEGRADDANAATAVASITDDLSFACLRAERALAANLGASCNTPLGAHAALVGEGRLRLRAWVGLTDGSEWLFDELAGALDEAEGLGGDVAERLRVVGAVELLARAEEMARRG